MRYQFTILFFFFFCISISAQNGETMERGNVSYASPQNIYVKYRSTEKIEIGDTLYIAINGKNVPALVVTNKSSTSCVCSPLDGIELNVSDEILAMPKKELPLVLEKEKTEGTGPAETANEPGPPAEIDAEEEPEEVYKQKIKGRISVASYSNRSDYGKRDRMRYGFSFRGRNIKNSRFSFENNIIFRHTLGEWAEVQDNLSRALKVYSFAARYDFSPGSNITLGRKINQKLSSMGAIDGIQYEKGIGQFVFGAIAGTRPDYSDYGFNPDLIQAGAFISHISDKRYETTTLAFAEQHNGGAIDRRFAYFQHSSNPTKKLNIFSSFEVDMFQNINGETKSEPRLTNLYLSARYRFSRKFSLRASYDNRKNIIYYESYKDFIENLIDQETRQGLRAGLSLRPIKFVTMGVNTSWRFQKSDMNLSKNLNAYLNVSRIPLVNARVSLRANFLQTNYLDSKIFGIRLSKDIIKRKVSSDVYFRMVDYQYRNKEYGIQQKVVGANVNIRVVKKLSLYFYLEKTFDNLDRNRTRINSKIIRRF